MKKIVGVIGLFFLPVLMVIVMFSGVEESTTTTDFSPQTEQEQVAYDVLQFVLSNGGTKEFASAWLGNMEHESNLIPSRVQSDLPYVEATAFNPILGGYGLGLAQWDSSRRVNLVTLAKKEGKDWRDTAFQLNFAWNHDGSDSELLKKYSKGTDINQMAVDILIHWERAGTKFDPMQQAQRKTSANNWFKRLSEGSFGSGSANVGGGKIDVLEAKMGQQVYNGQCYGLTSFYVDSFNSGIRLGAGSPNGIAGNIGNTVNAWEIGSAYSWASNGFIVINNPSYSDVKAGDIINWAQGGAASSSYGHTGIVASVQGNNKFTTYEQNAGQGQICARYERTWGVEFTKTTSIIRKK